MDDLSGIFNKIKYKKQLNQAERLKLVQCHREKTFQLFGSSSKRYLLKPIDGVQYFVDSYIDERTYYLPLVEVKEIKPFSLGCDVLGDALHYSTGYILNGVQFYKEEVENECLQSDKRSVGSQN